LPPSLSVFFPAYNDAPSLPSLVTKTFEVLNQITSDFEVIVVNDGSFDTTAEVLDELAARFAPRMRVIYMSGYADDVIAYHGILDEETTLVQKPFSPNALLQKLREVLDAGKQQPPVDRPLYHQAGT